MINTLKQKVQLYFVDKQNILSAALLVGCAGMVGWRAFNWYQTGQQAQAHAALIEVLYDFKIAAYLGKRWDDAELSALTGYRRFRSTKVAPYFLALQAQALAMQDKHAEALEVFKDALSKMKRTDPLFDNYQIQMALIGLDSKQPEEVSKALSALESFSQDAHFALRDEALYRIAAHYLLSNEYDKASRYLKTLISEYPVQKEGGSVWADYAREKFSTVIGVTEPVVQTQSSEAE